MTARCGRHAPATGSRRDRLRRATSAQHAALEARLEAGGCFDSLDGYARYLGAMAPLYAALEDALHAAGAGRLLPDWPRRRKAGLVRADLRALGARAPAIARVASGAEAGAMAALWHAGVVFAALYVLEGATLGGAVLARRVLRLGLTRERGAAFLDPYGLDRSTMWQGFLRALEGAELTPEEEGDLGPRSAAVFDLFAARVAAIAPGRAGRADVGAAPSAAAGGVA
ncbi:biliverdin-producing heme oxygenase [Paracraurococcus lichenis]|uniref:Biliverdin-producing heme oxygenase n=1 Tax=Paracraurococcus lichenis TaxID=3064888 RepID=A0ABT9EAX4_9PROT|nr:biliverdin-producing heme oxygenase [Paracraurococcus sp. LOR1-02]MDO9713311.1 biliverdin-producing heme oxygenase [Paracraurococcus sp. LOR1-02]